MNLETWNENMASNSNDSLGDSLQIIQTPKLWEREAAGFAVSAQDSSDAGASWCGC